MAYCENCATLEREVRRLEATILVRTGDYGFRELPKEFSKSGARSAYFSGYHAGWLNRPLRNAYTRTDCTSAYSAGYRKGEAKSLEEIGRILESGK